MVNARHLTSHCHDADEAVLQSVRNSRRWTIVSLLSLTAIINCLDRKDEPGNSIQFV